MTATLHLDATLQAARLLAPWLDELLDTPDFSAYRQRRGDIELALHEVVTNVVVHAFADAPPATSNDIDVREQKVRIHAEIVDNLLVFTVRDRGAAFDRGEYMAPDPATPQVHGYGLMILDQLCESCLYSRSGDENSWDMSFAPNLTSIQ